MDRSSFRDGRRGVQRVRVKFNTEIRLKGVFSYGISKDYKNQNKKKDAWQEIYFYLGIEADIIENEMKSLITEVHISIWNQQAKERTNNRR
jgi:hypothetical protein